MILFFFSPQSNVFSKSILNLSPSLNQLFPQDTQSCEALDCTDSIHSAIKNEHPSFPEMRILIYYLYFQTVILETACLGNYITYYFTDLNRINVRASTKITFFMH